LDIKLRIGDITKTGADAILFGVFDDVKKPPDELSSIDKALDGEITDAQREQLWKNIPLLFRPWLSEKAAIYARLSNAERPKFMDCIFKTLLTWQGADRLQTEQSTDGPSTTPHSMLSVFADQVEASKRDAEPLEREHISQFLWALQARALMM